MLPANMPEAVNTRMVPLLVAEAPSSRTMVLPPETKATIALAQVVPS